MIDENLQRKIEAEFQKIKQEVVRPNILLAGATGVGKSSLVNLCFGSKLAEVGIGKPVTETIASYSAPEVSVVLFDSKGYEVGSSGEDHFLREVIGLANDRSASPEKQIHLVWYCVQASGSRITDFDIRAVRSMTGAGLPVAVVLTKADLVNTQDNEQMKSVIRSSLPEAHVFETSTRTDLGGFDLESLMGWSTENLAESLRLGFIASQRLSIELKRNQAKQIVLQHSGGSAFVGFTPIPGSDAPILIANQTAMLARILFVFDLQNIITSISVMSIMGPLLSELGLFLVGNLLKFIPGLGSFVGGAINGAVAASVTYAFGTAVSELCATIWKAALSGSSDSLNNIISNAAPLLNEAFVRELNKKR